MDAVMGTVVMIVLRPSAVFTALTLSLGDKNGIQPVKSLSCQLCVYVVWLSSQWTQETVERPGRCRHINTSHQVPLPWPPGQPLTWRLSAVLGGGCSVIEQCHGDSSDIFKCFLPFMALNGLFCAEVPLRNYSLTPVRAHIQISRCHERQFDLIISVTLKFTFRFVLTGSNFKW